MPFWLPQGTVLLRLIEREVREQLDKRGYVEIKTPRVLDEELWHRSGPLGQLPREHVLRRARSEAGARATSAATRSSR